MNKYISVIFPAHNEEKRIFSAVKLTTDYFRGSFNNCEIIIVENGSTDNTHTIATAAALDLARSPTGNITIKLIRSRPGKGAAVRTGLQAATGSMILITDVDLSTPINEVERLIKTNTDLAIGSRKLPGSKVRGLTGRRLLASDFFAALAMSLTPGIFDTQCGFKLLSAEAAREIEPLLTLDGFAYDVELIHAAQQLGLNIREIPVTWTHDDNSTVKIYRDSARMARDLIKIWLNHARGHYAG